MKIRRIAVELKRQLQWGMLEVDRLTYSGSSRVGGEADGRAYILPADAPGGVGDDAMVGGVIQGLREVNAGAAPVVLAPTAFGKGTPFAEGAEIAATLDQWSTPGKELKKIPGGGDFIVLGADILDGHYSYVDAVKRIRMAGYAKLSGFEARIVGFSLNGSPHPKVIDEFNRLEGKVPLFLRDPVSFKRAESFFSGDIRLSADVAFMLPRSKTSYTDRIHTFADECRAKGLQVIGLNMHELFAKSSGLEVVEKLNRAFASVVEGRRDCGFVFIPHDFRSFIDDRIPLRKIYSLLSESAKKRVFLVDDPIRAGEIKEICAALDGVFTGRMHLAIAALGCGVPIFGIVYQGKFEGLLEHFQLDDRCVADPGSVIDGESLSSRFNEWMSRLDELKPAVSSRFEHVRNLSLSNLK